MSKAEIQEQVTNLIISELENGNAPWRKGWATGGIMPTNMVGGNEYQGINAMILSILGAQYARPLWMTYKQATALGGYVKQGEKGVHVIYYNMLTKDDGQGNVSRIPLMRSYTVFNVEQCANVTIPAKYNQTREPVTPLEATKSILDKYTSKPTVYYAEQSRAFYSPITDSITLPSLNQFDNPQEHAYTLTHELVHSTGHKSRLDRWSNGNAGVFGCENYAKEELIAELGSCMLLSAEGVELDIPNSGAYIKGWLKALKDDKSLIFTAATKASQAAQYIQGVREEVEVPA